MHTSNRFDICESETRLQEISQERHHKNLRRHKPTKPFIYNYYITFQNTNMMMSKTKKSVSFASEHDKIHPIESTLELVGGSEKDMSKLWFTSVQLRRIQIRAFKLSNDLKSNTFNEKFLELKYHGDTSRGLEFYSQPDFQQAARLRRNKSRTAVVTWSKMQHAKYSTSSALSSTFQQIFLVKK